MLVSLTGLILPYLPLLWSWKICLLRYIPPPSNPAGRFPSLTSLLHVSEYITEVFGKRERDRVSKWVATALVQAVISNLMPSSVYKNCFVSKGQLGFVLFLFLPIRKQAVGDVIEEKYSGLDIHIVLYHVTDNQVSLAIWYGKPLIPSFCPMTLVPLSQS